MNTVTAPDHHLDSSKTVLLIGANGGMGNAVAKALRAADYTVAATVSRPSAVAPFAEEYPDCPFVEALDLADADQVKAKLLELTASLKQINAVVVCSAIAPCAPAETVSIADFRRTIEINCTAALAIYQACLPRLCETKGRLILTGSYSGKVATPVMASYVASKFALEGLVDVMRLEAQEWEVDVVLVQPGALDTPMMRNTQQTLERIIATLPADVEKRYGRLYRQMKYRADEGLANSNYTSPETAAQTVIEALAASRPETRYPIGDDAHFMLDMEKSCSDREIDAFILDMYRSAPV